ncbi:MAG: type II/IV secretion system protein [Burkholderiales bacterium]|nr:type II/IV secretion system protein [Burkholderiales bacterium]
MHAPTERPGSQPAPRLGESLLRQGLITADQLRIALTEQREHRAPLGRLLVRLGFLSDSVIRDVLARRIGQESVDLSHVVVEADALARVPQELALRHRVLPIAFDHASRTLTLAVADTVDVLALDHLRARLDRNIGIRVLLASTAQLLDRIDQLYGHELSVDGILREIETGEIDYRSLDVSDAHYQQPVIRLVGALLGDAIKRGASDIHFEPEASFLRIRYRLDGVLEQVRSLHRRHWPGIAVRLKVMSGMDIAETRMPQDGRVSLTLNARDIDFRVASHPTIHGENIVLRVLDRTKSVMSLEQMQLASHCLASIEQMLARPEGIVIVTGPTGSGKTTTLYSLLSRLNRESVNIMTLEDPVEYPMAMMRQTSVGDAAQTGFAGGIRSIMRQDPDIILVGEIRDAETAQMAFRAAMTGHQVFTTLHTNSALGTFARLLDIGVPAEIIAGNIVGVIAQRLVRTLCPHCREAYTAPPEEEAVLGMPADSGSTLYRPAGCARCRFRGYSGRIAVMETLCMDIELDDAVARRAPMRELREAASAKGFRPLADDGIARILDGSTALAEVARNLSLLPRVQAVTMPDAR